MAWGSVGRYGLAAVARPTGAAEHGCAPLGWHGPQVAARQDDWADEPRHRREACARGGMDQSSEAVERPAAQHWRGQLRQTGGRFEGLVQDHAANPAHTIA